MRTIVKITKKEAIEAYIKFHKLHPESHVEIEEEILPRYKVIETDSIGSVKYYPPIQTGAISPQCIVCGDIIGNTVHACRGYKVTC